MSTKYCHSCLKQGQHNPVYSSCYECREFYCKTCSDIHPTLNTSKHHSVYRLLFPALALSVSDKDRLASVFLETADGDLPYTAQLKIIEDKDQSKCAALQRSDKKLSQGDPGNLKLKAGHCRDINVMMSEDETLVYVTGVLTLTGIVIVIDYNNEMLKLFNDRGAYLSCTALVDDARGITCVSDDTFATCGGNRKKVNIWNIHDQTATCSDVSYRVDYDAHGIMYDGTYYCVLHRDDRFITILDKQGKQVKQIKSKKVFGKKITLGWDIYMDDHSHNIYVPCQGDDGGVLCVSFQGEPLWFTPVSSHLWGITEIRGVLCVADRSGDCLHLLSKAGKYEGKLLEGKDLDGDSYYIHYDSQREKLYVNVYTNHRHVVSVYSVTS